MKFDLKRLGLGQQIAAGGALLLFIFFFFFDWYGVDLGRISIGDNGWHWHTLLRWLVLLTIVLAIGWAYLAMSEQTVSLPVPPSVILAAVAALTTLFVAWRVIIDHPGPDSIVGVRIGAVLGLLSLIAITAGAVLAMKAEGISVSEAGSQIRSAATSRTPSSESPTPPPAATTPPEPMTPPDAPSESSPTGS